MHEHLFINGKRHEQLIPMILQCSSRESGLSDCVSEVELMDDFADT